VGQVMKEWSHLSNETLAVLADMLATRNEKIMRSAQTCWMYSRCYSCLTRFSNVTKVALITFPGIDERLGTGM
jgi:hypothetical protein